MPSFGRGVQGNSTFSHHLKYVCCFCGVGGVYFREGYENADNCFFCVVAGMFARAGADEQKSAVELVAELREMGYPRQKDTDISQTMVEKTLHSLLASGVIRKIGAGKNTGYIRV